MILSGADLVGGAPLFLQRQGVWLCVGTQAPWFFSSWKVFAPPLLKIPGFAPDFFSKFQPKICPTRKYKKHDNNNSSYNNISTEGVLKKEFQEQNLKVNIIKMDPGRVAQTTCFKAGGMRYLLANFTTEYLEMPRKFHFHF